jgi:peptide/nickel transport system substrate-binding protein
VAIHRRFIVPPLRADGWWANLADWRTDPAQRLDRDRIGLGTPDGGAR